MKRFLAIALGATLNGCFSMNKLQLQQPSSVNATENTAQVLKVEATGEPNNYTFAVTVSSPDTGCDRYADWWEVITPKGELVYRRVLLHSHVDEQPFTRTGGTVAVQPQQEVIVRVHLSPNGYSTIALQGTVESGFSQVTLPDKFASSLASVEPLPDNCAF